MSVCLESVRRGKEGAGGREAGERKKQWARAEQGRVGWPKPGHGLEMGSSSGQ